MVIIHEVLLFQSSIFCCVFCKHIQSFIALTDVLQFSLLCLFQAFSKTRADDRKVWLTSYMDERRRCQEDQRPEPGSDLYTVDRRVLTYKDFINKELVMFSCADLERSVPSLVDGKNA